MFHPFLKGVLNCWDRQIALNAHQFHFSLEVIINFLPMRKNFMHRAFDATG
jgi:hypothetical protein